MKAFVIFLAIVVAILAQMWLIGINGLTLISIPITLYLGLDILEKVTETENTK